MINSVAVAPQTVAVNNNVLFPTDRVRTKSCNSCYGWLSHDVGSGLFTLSKPGIYEIHYNANITSPDIGTASLVLEQNGEPIGGTQSIHTIATAGALGNVSASTLVCVPCGASYTVTLTNNSTLALNVQDANIIIEKVA